MTLTDKIIFYLKQIPIDLGQESVSRNTKGKLIALSLVPDGKGKKALDVGCRDGRQAEWLAAKGYWVTAIDIAKSYPHCRIVDANKPLPFPSEEFDLIWCSEVIEHLDDPARSLGELRRVLARGGELILTTPNSYFWLMKILYLFGLSPQKVQRKDHKHFFNFQTVRNLFPAASIFGYFPYFWVKVQITRLLGPLTPTFVVYEKK